MESSGSPYRHSSVELTCVEQKGTVRGGLLNWLETHEKQFKVRGSLRVVVLGSAWVELYLQHLRDGRCSRIANVVVSKVEDLDGGVCLSEFAQKDTVSWGC